MTTFHDEWDEYLSNLQNRASQTFRQGGSYKLLREKLERAESDCRINFPRDDHAYIEAWVDAVLHIGSEEGSFLYEQAFRDCVSLLKALRVLA